MKKSKENILITRTLSKDSPLWQLSDDGHQIIHHSFLDIIPGVISEIPVANVYFYYSKNAVQYFLEAAKALHQDLSICDHAAMGSGTAQMLESHGIPPNFIGTQTPRITAELLIEKYVKSTICFVRAEQSTLSIQKHWPNEYSEVISYSATPKSIQIREEIHTIFATSPMNLKVAMECCNVKELKRIICIGPTTYSAAVKLSSVDIIMAEQSNERAMIDSFLSINLD